MKKSELKRKLRQVQWQLAELQTSNQVVKRAALRERIIQLLNDAKLNTNDETKLCQLQCEIDNLAEGRWDGPVPADHPDIMGGENERQ
jgi:hypothetical protein